MNLHTMYFGHYVLIVVISENGEKKGKCERKRINFEYKNNFRPPLEGGWAKGRRRREARNIFTLINGEVNGGRQKAGKFTEKNWKNEATMGNDKFERLTNGDGRAAV